MDQIVDPYNRCLQFKKQMGNIANLLSRIKSYVKKDQNAISYFEYQQAYEYPKQYGFKCLQHLIEIGDLGNLNSLKKLHKFIYPALQYLQYCKFSSNDGSIDIAVDLDFIRIHEEQIINSANNVMMTYFQFLRKVVPANISYFHFMRQKDFYSQYIALKYFLEAGQIGAIFKSSNRISNVFNRIKTESKVHYARFISHWLYDMVKYRCSAIYLQSTTVTYLILMNAVVLCGFLVDQRKNILHQYQKREKNSQKKLQIYQHCLYSFIYILAEGHNDKKLKSRQGNGSLQVILIGTIHLLNSIWSDKLINMQGLKTMYCPSYWYVELIGFIKNPNLQTMLFLIILDLIYKSNNKQKYAEELSSLQTTQSDNRLSKKISVQFSQKLQSDHIQFKKGNEQKIFSQKQINFEHEQILQLTNIESEIQHRHLANLSLMKKSTKQQQFYSYSPINNMSKMMLYNCVLVILNYFPKLANLQSLQKTLLSEINALSPQSFIRPFVLKIIRQMMKQSEISSPSLQNDTEKQEQNTVTKHINEQIIAYHKNNRMSYSVDQTIVSQETVGKNCQIFIIKAFPKILQNYYKQTAISDGQIWGQILKYNVHEMQ